MFKNLSQKICILFLFIIFFVFLYSITYLIIIDQYAETLAIVPLHCGKNYTAWLALDEDIGIYYFFSINSNKSLDFSYYTSDSNIVKSYYFSDVRLLINNADLESENFQRKTWIWCIKNLPDRPNEIYPIIKNPPSMGPARDLSETLCDLAADQLNLSYRWRGHRWMPISNGVSPQSKLD